MDKRKYPTRIEMWKAVEVERQQILDKLHEIGRPMNSMEVWTEVGGNSDSIYRTLCKMAARGEVEKITHKRLVTWIPLKTVTAAAEVMLAEALASRRSAMDRLAEHNRKETGKAGLTIIHKPGMTIYRNRCGDHPATRQGGQGGDTMPRMASSLSSCGLY
jgi:hypothetical protein